MAESNISEEMRASVGKVYERIVSFPISEADIRRWVVATYHPEVPPRDFWDQATAANAGDILAPHEFNPFAWMTVEPEGLPPRIDGDAMNRIEDELGIEGPNLTQGLNGGVEVEYFNRMRPGDAITSETSLNSYSEKSGRLGLMLFSRTLSEWTNQNGDLVKKTYNTVIRY